MSKAGGIGLRAGVRWAIPAHEAVSQGRMTFDRGAELTVAFGQRFKGR
jgi:hypothetical protein